MPEHRTLVSADVHEPKHITSATTADAGKIITPSAASNGVSVIRRMTDTDLSYTDKTKNLYGWNDISDSQYTSGAPRAVSSGVRTLLTNNGLGSKTDTSRLGALWNSGASKFVINDLNGFYVLKLALKCTAAAVASAPYIVLLELESASGPTVVSGETHFIKGGGNINQLSVPLSFYVDSTVNNQDLKIYVTPDTNIDLYGVSFVIKREYKET